MNQSPEEPRASEQRGRERGQRAEQVAEWYFRLNGFLAIPGFVVHLDTAVAEPRRRGLRPARTEADFMAVRFPYSVEVIADRPMEDAAWISHRSYAGKQLFILVEVKAGVCRLNGPWTDAHARNMQRVIRRLGFVEAGGRINEVADSMYRHARWDGETAVVQYVCVGGEKDPDLSHKYRDLVQLDWSDVGAFLFERFRAFPEKLPSAHVHHQWPDFGRAYSNWFVINGHIHGGAASPDAVRRFIDRGSCDEEPGTA